MLKINDILRAGDVTRWNIVHTSKTSTVAEHQYNVAMIARAIAKLSGCPDSNLIKAALQHDLDEVILGDIPSPTKARARAMGIELNNILGEDVSLSRLDIEEKAIFKVADVMENAWFIRNYGIGRHAEQVSVEMEEKLQQAISLLPPTICDAARSVWAQLTLSEFII